MQIATVLAVKNDKVLFLSMMRTCSTVMSEKEQNS